MSSFDNPWRCDSALAWLCDLPIMDHKIKGMVKKYETYGRVGINDYDLLECTAPRMHEGIYIKHLRMSNTTNVN